MTAIGTNVDLTGWPQCADETWERAVGANTRCRKPAGHRGKHDDGALQWCSAECDCALIEARDMEWAAEIAEALGLGDAENGPTGFDGVGPFFEAWLDEQERDLREGIAKRDAEWGAALGPVIGVMPATPAVAAEHVRNAIGGERASVLKMLEGQRHYWQERGDQTKADATSHLMMRIWNGEHRAQAERTESEVEASVGLEAVRPSGGAIVCGPLLEEQ